VPAEDVDQPPDGRDVPVAAVGGQAPTRSGAVLSFPDLPRLELDELLAQLVERAQEVIGTQGRLRGLLRANHLVTGDLSLPAVLRRIVEAARELVDARYAAIGVIAPGGGLAEFVHSGMPEDDVARIGHLPEGRGLLGALLADPAPIRLRHITDDARSAGFPPGHPPMESFLGVPIRVRDEIFGRLYLSESGRGEFTADDEELVTALAATAGVAIANARLYESARSRGQWLQASATVTRQLLSTAADAEDPLRLIADRSRDITGADLVAVLLPTEAHGLPGLEVRVAVGQEAESLADRWVPVAGSLPGRVFTEAAPVRLADVRDAGGPALLVSPDRHVGPVLAVPLLGSRTVHGVLWAARLSAAPAFTADELEMAGSFANHAAVAIELAEARAEQQRVAMLDERERIAADLHDHVIQRLFAAGLSLQSIAMVTPEGPTKQRLSTTIQDLDDTISQIRTTIFQLQRQPATGAPGVRARVLDVLGDVAPALGFDPALRLSGVLEDRLAADLVDDMLAVLREALTNVARHAQAGRADVAVVATGTDLTLQVTDDGVGIGAVTRRSGLTNMRRRAEQRGGTLAVTAVEPRGTRIRWSVPLA
jgi:signal transduction histidine kinase